MRPPDFAIERAERHPAVIDASSSRIGAAVSAPCMPAGGFDVSNTGNTQDARASAKARRFAVSGTSGAIVWPGRQVIEPASRKLRSRNRQIGAAATSEYAAACLNLSRSAASDPNRSSSATTGMTAPPL